MEASPTPIQRACKAVGSASALAKLIDTSPQFVSQLVAGVRKVPAELCPLIERATRDHGASEGDVVMCEELRPDIAWGVLRTQSPIEQG